MLLYFFLVQKKNSKKKQKIIFDIFITKHKYEFYSFFFSKQGKRRLHNEIGRHFFKNLPAKILLCFFFVESNSREIKEQENIVQCKIQRMIKTNKTAKKKLLMPSLINVSLRCYLMPLCTLHVCYI